MNEDPRKSAPLGAPPGRGGDGGGRLDWTDPGGQARSLPFGAMVRIGRAGENDIILHDKLVSRRHATIVGEGGRYVLTDLNSANGTLVNDRPITGTAELRPGDRITIGDTVLTFSKVVPIDLPPRPERTTAARVVAATLAPDGSTVVPVEQTTVGWLELPTGEQRILGSEVRLGRSAKNDITIEDPQCSRVHALIRRIDDRYVLSDLGSANGVAVNGEQVLMPRTLTEGDRIEMGETVLRFHLRPLTAADGASRAE